MIEPFRIELSNRSYKRENCLISIICSNDNVQRLFCSSIVPSICLFDPNFKIAIFLILLYIEHTVRIGNDVRSPPSYYTDCIKHHLNLSSSSTKWALKFVTLRSLYKLLIQISLCCMCAIFSSQFVVGYVCNHQIISMIAYVCNADEIIA